jgi:hypothetical protein
MLPLTPRQIERFWSHIDRTTDPDGCWLWKRSRSHNGYGQWGGTIGGRHRVVRSHRVAYELTHGEVPDGKQVCHTCDVRHCCSPKHLYICSPKENTRDMMERTGHNRPHARFTDDEVREFRRRYAAGESLTTIAVSADHDVSAMRKLLRGLHYRHVE